MTDGFTLSNPERTALQAAEGDDYIQVDKFDDAGGSGTATAAAAYTLRAFTPECIWSAACTTPGSPVCSPEFTCTAGYDECTDDDAAENDDDGAGLAPAVDPPVDGAPLELERAICSSPAASDADGTSLEQDWFRVTRGDSEQLSATLTWSDMTADLDMGLFDATGSAVAVAATEDQNPETFSAAPGAGTYYLLVMRYAPTGAAAATPYTLSLQRAAAAP